MNFMLYMPTQNETICISSVRPEMHREWFWNIYHILPWTCLNKLVWRHMCMPAAGDVTMYINKAQRDFNLMCITMWRLTLLLFPLADFSQPVVIILMTVKAANVWWSAAARHTHILCHAAWLCPYWAFLGTFRCISFSPETPVEVICIYWIK